MWQSLLHLVPSPCLSHSFLLLLGVGSMSCLKDPGEIQKTKPFSPKGQESLPSFLEWPGSGRNYWSLEIMLWKKKCLREIPSHTWERNCRSTEIIFPAHSVLKDFRLWKEFLLIIRLMEHWKKLSVPHQCSPSCHRAVLSACKKIRRAKDWVKWWNRGVFLGWKDWIDYHPLQTGVPNSCTLGGKLNQK